jgi:hypothetical protein
MDRPYDSGGEFAAAIAPGHRLIMPQPDACGCELDEGEIVGGAFFVLGGDGSPVGEEPDIRPRALGTDRQA